MKWFRQHTPPIYSPIAIMLCSCLAFPVYALGLTEQKYTELGGALDAHSTTVNAVDNALNQPTLDDKFNAVGLVISDSYCSGTWLGTQDDHAYILTAAHCLAGAQSDQEAEYTGQHVSFRTGDGRLIASGTSTNYFKAYQGCGTDIAVAKIPLLTAPLDSSGNQATPPYVDSDPNTVQRLLKPIEFAGYGILGSPSLGQVRSIGRRHGQGEFFDSELNCLINRAYEGASDRWAFASPGDSGSAVWQQDNDHNLAIAVTSWWMGWAGYTSGHGAIAPHIDWLRQVAPVVKTLEANPDPRQEEEENNEPKLTETTPLVFDEIEKEVRGTVYYLPFENVLKGPKRRIWRYPSGHSRLLVELTESSTGQTHPVVVRAQRLTHCGWGQINNGAWCYPRANLGTLKVSFSQADNPELPLGHYQGAFTLKARGWHMRRFSKLYEINADITLDSELPVDGTVTETAHFEGPRYDDTVRGSVYYLAPKIAKPKRPRWHGRLNTWTRLKVPVTNVETNESQILRLRAQRYAGCGWTKMNNAAYCTNGPHWGQIKVQYVATDNPNLPEGQYEAKINIQVRGLRERSFQEDLYLNVDVTHSEAPTP